MRLGILILMFVPLTAITFERTYGKPGFDDWADVVQVTSDLGYIIGGTTSFESANYWCAYPIKTDSLGDTIWSHSGAWNTGIIRGILQTPDSGYLALAENLNYQNTEFELLKYDKLGNWFWKKNYGGDSNEAPYDLLALSDSNYLGVGITNSYGAGGYDIWLVKFDLSGTMLWDRTYGGIDDDLARDIDQVGDGFIIAGATASYGNGLRDVYLIRTDSLGDSLWMKTYGGADDDIGMAVKATPDGGFIIAGATYSYGAGSYDVYLIKTDSSGDTIWMRTFGGPDWDGAYGLCLSLDSCYVVVGETRSFGFGTSDVYLLKVNQDGNLLWQKTYGFADEDRGYDIHTTSDSGFIITGATRGPNGLDWDIYLIKTDAEGNIRVTEEGKPSLNKLKIYPNPSFGRINLDLASDVQEITIFDATGRRAKRLKPSPRMTLTLTPGIYFLKIKTESQIGIRKIIILR